MAAAAGRRRVFGSPFRGSRGGGRSGAGAGPGLFLGKPRECAFPPARGGSALPEPNL